MNPQKPWWLGWVALFSVCAGGCKPQQQAPLSASQRDAIQARATTNFESAWLFKPVEAGRESPIAVRLAPILIRQVTQTNATRPGREGLDWPDAPRLVVGETGATVVNGRSHQQLGYTWTAPARTAPEAAGQTTQTTQGVRLTLNSNGAPVLWEVLEDLSGATVLYAAQSLERAARAEFGPPLPGRKFSIERNLAETSQIIVANVIEDGPLPMGPILYLQSESGDVAALICRCMPSQAQTLLGQEDYELNLADAKNKTGRRFPPAQWELRLRLPRDW